MRFWRILTLLLVVAVAGINLWRTGTESLHQATAPVVSPAAGYATAVPTLFATGYAWLIGALLTGLLWPRRGEIGLVLSVGAGVGIGLTSLVYFLAGWITTSPVAVVYPVELLLCCVLFFLWLRKMRTIPPLPVLAPPARSWLGSLVRSVFLAGCAIALYALASTWPPLSEPPANLLLISAGLARIRAYAGTETSLAAGLVPAIFTFATVGLLIAGVNRLRNRLIALAGGLMLLGTPGFVRFTPGTSVDIPVGFYLLAATILVSIARDEDDGGILFLAGLTAGLAAWTGQTGLIFCAALGLFFVLTQALRKRWRNLPPLLGGLALTLVPLVWFKFGHALPAGNHSAWPGLGPALPTGWRDLPRFGEWYSLPFLMMALHLIGPGRGWLERRTVVVAALLLLVLAGKYAAGLLSPSDLPQQPAAAPGRLLMQVWPVAVFLWCQLAVRAAPAAAQTSPAESPADLAPSGQSA